VTLGGSLAGIVGSLLAVPIAALIAVVWNYVREQLREPSQDSGTDESDAVAAADPA
jgi:predicted PurR-regulated permease PerM